ENEVSAILHNPTKPFVFGPELKKPVASWGAYDVTFVFLWESITSQAVRTQGSSGSQLGSWP
ncbi:MAG: hypothetical protein ACPG4V_11455, partial [Limisphaerales bacterium]